jgi:hypothetical protein
MKLLIKLEEIANGSDMTTLIFADYVLIWGTHEKEIVEKLNQHTVKPCVL